MVRQIPYKKLPSAARETYNMMRIGSDAFMFLDFESDGEITKSKNLKIDCVTTPEEIEHISISKIEFLKHFGWFNICIFSISSTHHHHHHQGLKSTNQIFVFLIFKVQRVAVWFLLVDYWPMNCGTSSTMRHSFVFSFCVFWWGAFNQSTSACERSILSLCILPSSPIFSIDSRIPH